MSMFHNAKTPFFFFTFFLSASLHGSYPATPCIPLPVVSFTEGGQAPLIRLKALVSLGWCRAGAVRGVMVIPRRSAGSDCKGPEEVANLESRHKGAGIPR